ncbi:MAG: fatty acid desaturase [Candidatus Eremiobacteraeota bacterium]|nr:fatty acid desaturase [Candidatus Eremiobacteraeota bacterium]MBV9055077.1 fatty acid desaturase [Candidatus Eremiobacteraeota bacterium]MBV9698853.1 fatty acid desaturase [Candidatus Eremiobacteraeota bacterium]
MDRWPRYGTGIGLGVIHVGALAALIPAFFHPSALIAAAIASYCTGALGVTLCYHRVLTHRSLRLRKPLEYLFAIFGTLALQGDPIRWVAIHRKHHAHADDEGDPHSIRRGFKWAHMDWLYRNNIAMPTQAEILRYAPDLYADRFYRALQYLSVPLQLSLAVAFFSIGGWSWVIWGIFVRLVASYHSTWLVNSASHMLGYRTYRTGDRSTNCWWVAMVSFGEGWHNNHHAFPFSARHGLRWFEIDMTWWHVKVLAFLRLADRIRIPSEAMRRRLAHPAVRPLASVSDGWAGGP